MTNTTPGTPSTPAPPVFPASDADWALVARLVAGELPADEADAVRARIGDDAALAQLVHTLGQRFPYGARAAVNVDAALDQVHLRMHTRARLSGIAPARERNRAIPVWMRAAAAVVVLAGAAWVLRPHTSVPVTVATAPSTVFRTAVGQRDSIVLADGTRVMLGPGSALTVPADMNANREVALVGEARFDVIHDPAHPFAVRTAEALVTDIGTTFTVRSYDGAGADVSVAQGTVALRSLARVSDSVTLVAGDAGAVGTDGRLTKTPHMGAAEDAAWLNGQLVFRDAPLVKVRADIRRWHGVELVVADSTMAAQHLTASFRGETREQVMGIIALALGGTFEMHGDTAVLRARGRAPTPR